MSGRLVELFTMREFTFSASNEVVIIKALDVSQWTGGTLLLRLHVNGMGNGSSMNLAARATAPSPEDPSQDFVYTTSNVGSASVSNTDSAPFLAIDGLTADFGSHLQIVVAGTKGSGACVATISGAISLND